MAELVLGPVLRHVGETDATVWVETDSACEVEVLGARERSFQVAGRHYALVHVTGLEPGTVTEYEVRLDDEPAWPQAGSDFPPSVIHTQAPDQPLQILFGSCRIAGDRPSRRAPDALRAAALRMARAEPGHGTTVLLMLGDQIYADDLSSAMEARVRQRSRPGPPDELCDFEDYALAYCESWGEPAIRWLLSTVATLMIFDDHEIADEWKISQTWVDRMRAQEWYDQRITGGLMSYWLYQHLGNLEPTDLRDNELLRAAREADDAAEPLREFARDADRQPGRSRWSFARDFGRTRLVVLDSRASRELRPDARRLIDREEWSWVTERVTGGVEHLLLASSLPFLLAPGLHRFEAFSERLCGGRFGRRAARAGERLRQAANLGHWAAFQASFRELAALLEDVATGRRGEPPRSLVMLSGDVHHCYLAEVAFRRAAGARSRVWQAVSSPFRKELGPRERAMMRFGTTDAGAAIGRALAAAAGVEEPPMRWRLRGRPRYDNQISTLSIDGPEVWLHVKVACAPDRLRTAFKQRLA